MSSSVASVTNTPAIDRRPPAHRRGALGVLLHGIVSSIARFYSKNLASEVSKGLNQKFETGGTPMRAPIGYLNVRKRDEQDGKTAPGGLCQSASPSSWARTATETSQ